MAQLLKPQQLSEEEAYPLVERLLNRGVPVYLIRDELVGRGYSAYAANQLIQQVRSATREERVTNPDDMRSLLLALGLFVGLMFLIAVVLVVTGNI